MCQAYLSVNAQFPDDRICHVTRSGTTPSLSTGASTMEQDAMSSTGYRKFRPWAGIARALAVLVLLFWGATAARPESEPAPSPLDDAMAAVLVVRTNDSADRFLGSAFLWGETGTVAVTNAHVVGSAEELRLVDRTGAIMTGTVIARDDMRDVAVIALPPAPEGQPRRGLVPADEAPGLGTEVFALGAPFGIEFTLTEGRISAMARQVEINVPLRLLQHDAAVNPGSSGGPLVDAAGRLLGMNSQIADGSRMFVGIAYAIAAPDLARIVAGLIDETLAPLPKLGLNLRPVDRALAAALGIAPAGLLVDAAAAGGPGAAAGLKAGDVILGVDGQNLAAPGDFVFAIEAAQATGGVALSVWREGAEIALALDFSAVTAPVLGLKVRDLAGVAPALPERSASYRLGALGVVLGEAGLVEDITAQSPAFAAGLVKGDRILAVNGQEQDDAALARLEIAAPALVLVRAPDGTTRHLYLDPWARSATPARAAGGANVLDPAVVVF